MTKPNFSLGEYFLDFPSSGFHPGSGLLARNLSLGPIHLLQGTEGDQTTEGMPSPCPPHSNHCSSSSYANLLALSGRFPEMPCLGAFSAWGQAWPVSGLPTRDQRHVRLGTHSHSDPQGRQGPEGPTVAAQAGQTIFPPLPPLPRQGRAHGQPLLMLVPRQPRIPIEGPQG